MHPRIETIVKDMNDKQRAKLAAEILNHVTMTENVLNEFYKEIDDSTLNEIIMRAGWKDD